MAALRRNGAVSFNRLRRSARVPLKAILQGTTLKKGPFNIGFCSSEGATYYFYGYFKRDFSSSQKLTVAKPLDTVSAFQRSWLEYRTRN